MQTLVNRISLYSAVKPSTTLFVHFDKNVYTNNENVWFTGYVVKSALGVGAHNTLSVALIRDDDRSVLVEEKFLMSNGLAFGNIFLPDSLPAGNYNFIAYTNKMDSEGVEDVFVQPVTIKTVTDPAFIATLKVVERASAATDSITVVLRAYTKDITLVRGGLVEYQVGDSGAVLIKGKLTTDNFGEAKIRIPAKKVTPSNNLLRTTIRYNKESRNINLRLPLPKNEPIIKFYPEGGYLVTNKRSVVGWEANDQEGLPLMVQAVLYKNGLAADTLRTDNWGLGRFSIYPEKGSDYTVKLVDGASQEFKLPIALPEGPVVTLKNSLADDTLLVQLQSSGANNKWLILLHNFQESFLETSVPTGSRSIKIPLSTVPKGLVTLTLIDATGKPRAERMFFAHYDKRTLVDINTDKALYHTREKVQLKVALPKAQKGLMSIAVIQDNRIEQRKMNDIESYAYLKHQLSQIPSKTKLFGNSEADRQFLENLLLVKGWRRYTWLDMMSKYDSAVVPVQGASITGTVTFKGKALKQPVDVGIFGDKLFNVIRTDTAGHFTIPNEYLISEPEKQLKLFVSNKKQNEHSITINDPYYQTNRVFATQLVFQDFESRAPDQNSQVTVINSNERANKLLDVKVTTKRDNGIYATGTNECGDWVCQYNILNCRNHPMGRPPVAGQRYFQFGASVIYQGCGKTKETRSYVISLNGIYINKEFYVSDYSKYNPPEPEYLSTLFWSHSILTDQDGKASVSFYTGDIPGKFRVIVQGITDRDVFAGEQTFEVTKE